MTLKKESNQIFEQALASKRAIAIIPLEKADTYQIVFKGQVYAIELEILLGYYAGSGTGYIRKVKLWRPAGYTLDHKRWKIDVLGLLRWAIDSPEDFAFVTQRIREFLNKTRLVERSA